MGEIGTCKGKIRPNPYEGSFNMEENDLFYRLQAKYSLATTYTLRDLEVIFSHLIPPSRKRLSSCCCQKDLNEGTTEWNDITYAKAIFFMNILISRWMIS